MFILQTQYLHRELRRTEAAQSYVDKGLIPCAAGITQAVCAAILYEHAFGKYEHVENDDEEDEEFPNTFHVLQSFPTFTCIGSFKFARRVHLHRNKRTYCHVDGIITETRVYAGSAPCCQSSSLCSRYTHRVVGVCTKAGLDKVQ